MEISQDINYQKQNLDLPQLNPEQNLPQGRGRTDAPDAPAKAATVSLSDKGRAAASSIDFTAEADTLSQLQALGSSPSFGQAYASVSYDKVKHLLD